MDEGKSKYYPHALSWLERAAKPTWPSVAGRLARVLRGLIARHGRKYSLVPGLRELLRAVGLRSDTVKCQYPI